MFKKNDSKNALFFLCKILFCIALNISCAPQAVASLSDKIEAALQASSPSFNGVILITKGPKIIYKKALGDKGQPKIKSQLIIASLSKQMTAVLVMQAVEKGLIALNKPIKTYLPSLRDKWADTVTPHHLLNHTSGIKALGQPLLFTPGKSFSYSNVGYDLLGKILHNATHKTYNDLAQSTFKKLKMNASIAPRSGTVTDLQKSLSHLLTGYMESDDKRVSQAKKVRLASSNPSGGIISTAHDLLIWNIAFHEGGFLSKKSYQQMVTPSAERSNRWGEIGYGYGVQILEEAGILEISHTGVIEGYLTTLLYYPKKKISVIILENYVLWPDQWNLNTKKIVFQTHDLIRSIIRSSL